MADKTLIPSSLVIAKRKGVTQFYDRNSNIASLPNKQVKVFEDEGQGWEHAEAGNGAATEEPASASDDAGESTELAKAEASDGQGDMVLDALDNQPAEGESSESSEEPAATAPTKSKSRGSGKAKVNTMATAKAKAAAPKKAAAKKAGKVTVLASSRKQANGATAAGLIRTVAGRQHDISGYTKVKNSSGHTSYDNGDDVAEKLRGFTLDQVYDLASKQLKEDRKALVSKYKHLNPGMQRMSLGNRLRKVAREKAAA